MVSTELLKRWLNLQIDALKLESNTKRAKTSHFKSLYWRELRAKLLAYQSTLNWIISQEEE